MSGDRNIKVLGWNIHGAAGFGNYQMPPFIAGELMNQDADIVVLTEFVIASGWDYIRSILEEKYTLFPTYVPGENGILIAIKKDSKELMADSYQVSIDMNTVEEDRPNFLQVRLNGEKDKPLYIIGIRIRDSNHTPQFEALRDHLISLSDHARVICIGDFNEWPKPAQQKLCSIVKVYAPRYNDFHSVNNPMYIHPSRWSYVPKPTKKRPEGEAVIDFIAVRNVKILKNSEDDLSRKRGYKMYAKYDWSFVNEKNGYGKLTAKDLKTEAVGLPDHAILTAECAID